MLAYLNEKQIVQDSGPINTEIELERILQNNGETLVVTNKSEFQHKTAHRFFYEGYFDGYSKKLLFSIESARKGKVRNPDKKDEYGFYIGKYAVDKHIYFIWKNMERRCYYSDTNGFHNYGAKGVQVSDSFKCYAFFESWYKQNNYGLSDLEIDKDVKSSGTCKMYSPETCILIPSAINTFISTLGENKGIEEVHNKLNNTYCVHYRRKYKRINKNFKTLEEAKSFKRNLDIEYLELLISQYELPDDIKQALRTYVEVL